MPGRYCVSRDTRLPVDDSMAMQRHIVAEAIHYAHAATSLLQSPGRLLRRELSLATDAYESRALQRRIPTTRNEGEMDERPGTVLRLVLWCEAIGGGRYITYRDDFVQDGNKVERER